MNILILTPIHPMQIVEMNELYSKYGQYNNVFSIQAMALLAEEQEKKNYLAANIAFTRSIAANAKLLKTRGKKIEHTIIYGNIDRNTPIKFDHILAVTDEYGGEETFDPYWEACCRMVEDAGEVAPNYYTLEDAHYKFPTKHHLFIFLQTLQLKENDNDTDDTI